MNQTDILTEALKKSLNYEEYNVQAERELNLFDMFTADKTAIERNDARKINLVRMSRIEKQFQPENESIEVLNKINQKLFWIVISENWCGDSAQILPIIAKLVSINSMIDFKVVFRDKNPEFMNNYLTNGKRSIPKLIIFDEDFQELTTWGPRPSTAQKLMKAMLEEQIEKPERLKKLHLWYAKNSGREIENEIISLVEFEVLRKNVSLWENI